MVTVTIKTRSKILPVRLFPVFKRKNILTEKEISKMFIISTPNFTLGCTFNDSLVITLKKRV
jgi:hypothetical protein